MRRTAAVISVAVVAAAAGACGSSRVAASPQTVPASTASTASPPTSTTTTTPTTTTTLPNVQPWKTKITSCTDNSVSGTLTNTGTVTNTYIVTVSDDSGSFELGGGDTEVVNVPPGHTVSWSAKVTFSNAPTGPVSCSVIDVLANYPYS
jgi:hypothetical protein